MESPSLLKQSVTGDLSVATFGQEGSLCHQALLSIFDGDEKLKVSHARSFDEVFNLIARGDCHSGVVPVENTSIGPMPGIYDLILRYPSIKIIGEHIMLEDHCLCALPGTKLEDVDQIVAHPWAGAQCSGYLRHLQRDTPHPIAQVQASDTAAACQAAHDRKNTATIQSRAMVEKFGLAVLAEGISDDTNNKTRFALLSTHDVLLPPFEQTSTTVAFALENKTNALFKALSVFALRDIGIRRIVTVRLRPAELAELRREW